MSEATLDDAILTAGSTPNRETLEAYYRGRMTGGHMGNPNPLNQSYTCQTCGEPRPPYQFYCDQHLEDGEKNDKPLLIDRFIKRLFGRS